MNRSRTTIVTTLLLAFVTCVDAGDRPNIVFIFADDLGWGDIACHGHPQILTPNLDRLAAEGTDFQQFVVCNPVCSPSRTACMTGQYPGRLSVHAHFAGAKLNRERGMPNWLDPTVPNLASRLKNAGYRTGHFGKWHLTGGGIPEAPAPSAYGFDQSNVYVGPGAGVFDEDSSFAKYVGGNAHGKESASFLSAAATEHAIRFVNAGDGPFFINLWLHETHHLVSATERDKQPYPNVAEPERTYYAAVTRADRLVGELLAAIDELGQTENTLVVFSSDNGPEHSQPNPDDKLYYSVGTAGGMRGQKRSLYMGGVNVPFLVKWPGVVPAGRVDKSTVLAGVDLYPTFLAAANASLSAGENVDGVNIMSALKGESFERPKPLFWEWRGPYRRDPDWPAYGVRDGDWTLVMDVPAIERKPNGRTELYQLSTDRTQQTNIAASRSDIVDRLREQVDAWRKTLPSGPFATPAGAVLALTEAQQNRLVIFRRKDTDSDGVLSLAEWLAGNSNERVAKARLTKWDDDGDGMLSEKEFVAPNVD